VDNAPKNKPNTEHRGRGKPALFGFPMKRHNVMLDDATIEVLREIGGGNISAGIRAAAAIIWAIPRKTGSS
jgi:hypothetical protein